MKTFTLLAAVAALAAAPAFAEDAKKEAAPASAAMMSAKADAKPMELKAGGWVKVDDKGMAWVSKDDGKTWMAAPDGMHELKDGTKVETKAGMVMKK